MARKTNLSRRRLLTAAIASPLLAAGSKLIADEPSIGPCAPPGQPGLNGPPGLKGPPGPVVIEPQFFMFETTGDVICHPAAVATLTAHLAEQQDG